MRDHPPWGTLRMRNGLQRKQRPLDRSSKSPAWAESSTPTLSRSKGIRTLEERQMANSLIVRGRSELVPPTSTGRAAQYVRMSTDHQRYSTQNQAATIAVYADQHNLTIARTYADEGKSGVVITRRDGLIELINDVRFGRA